MYTRAVTALLLIAAQGSALSPFSSIPGPLEFVLDVSKFAFEIYKHIDEKTTSSKNKEEIINSLALKIDSTSEFLYKKLVLNLQYNKIEETQMEINSRMIDLKNCLTAKESDAGGYRGIFMKWAYPAVSKARYLSKYFLDNIQGEGKNIIQLAAELSRCNLTAMDIMAYDSIELMSDGMLIEMTWLRMDKNSSMDIATAFWQNELKNVVAGFQAQYASCSSKEREHALEDLQNTDNIIQLKKNNAERYQWAWNDVFGMDNEIPDVFGFKEVDQNRFLVHNSKGKTKIVTYSKTKEPVSTFTANSLSQIVKLEIAIGSEDAKEIAAKVKEEMQKGNVEYSALLVYFNGAKYQPATVIDQESQAIRTNTEKGYTVYYCNSALCTINWNNWLNIQESKTGYFTVYVVVDTNTNKGTSKHSYTSGGATLDPLSVSLFLICVIRLVDL